MKKLLYGFVFILFFGLFFSESFAHTEVTVQDYLVDVGWGEEPPVVGFRNFIFIKVLDLQNDNEGVVDAFQNIDASIRSGGATKDLDIIATDEPGVYHAKIIPTETGTIAIKLRGDLNGTVFDLQIPIEDVESTAVLEFPLKAGGGSSDQEVTSLKSAVTSIQSDVSELKSKLIGFDGSSERLDPQTAYNFGMIGMSTGVAGVVLGVFAVLRRNK